MFNKEIPVVDIADFQGITIDAVKWNNQLYTVVFNFWKNVDLATLKSEKTSDEGGMVLCTHIEGRTLEECWTSIQLVLKSRILEGCDIYLYGNLWTEEGEILHDIDWTDYCDDETAERLLTETSIEHEMQKHSLIDRYPISSTVH
jgi:hypothetical protein